MTQIYVSVGSNQQALQYVPMALDAIKSEFSPVTMSPVYESVAVGFDGENFLNLVVGFETGLSLCELAGKLGQIEQSCGRRYSEERFTSRTMDLDLLIYGDLLRHDDEYDIPREEIIRYAFVLKPLSQLVPDYVHPELGMSFSRLWQERDFSGQDLWEVEL
ncbi:2-amino-4-hydroxy-6-hydroxymethyldihydropteridine pyrophosphokinase [bacterium BMS3Bbin11]|nr:2-amino-4-hydroxy-6-hydroxymethyldihydropteridine pyrophosphokinase [bacterium BMS3Abin11]GBE45625.1 2-amino-4-hydroxy-6-hydroxymethyldihydropteridine pyrophosphokinase [bacterium BMS3Bbin11]